MEKASKLCVINNNLDIIINHLNLIIMKATLIGKISRIAKVCGSGRTELTIEVKETTIGDTTFTIGSQVCCEVSNSIARNMQTKEVCALATGDQITIVAENDCMYSRGKWIITSLSHHKTPGQALNEFLNDLVKELSDKK